MYITLLFSTFRSLWYQKTVSLITVISLFVGLMVFSLSLLYVKRELSYNTHWPEADQLHRLVIRQQGLPGSGDSESSGVNARLLDPFVEHFVGAEVSNFSRVVTLYPEIATADGEKVQEDLLFVDPGFADLFRVETVQGSIEDALSGPSRLALEEGFAQSLGEQGRVGQRLSMESQVGTTHEFEVVAIYRLPEPVSRQLSFYMLTLIDDALLPFLQNVETQRGYPSWNDYFQMWIRLDDNVSTAQFNAMQPDFIDEEVTVFKSRLEDGDKVSNHLFYQWQRVDEMYLNPLLTESGGSKARIITFAAVGLLVLLVSCSNAISLSLSSILQRKKEIGIRKAAGASRLDIIKLYGLESLLLILISVLPVLYILTSWHEQIYNLSPALWGFSAVMPERNDLLLISGLAVLVGFINNIYPSLMLASYKPQAVMAGEAVKGSGFSLLRNLLVLTQFACACVLLIGTAALFVQLAVTRAQPKGFSVENVVLFFPSSVATTISTDTLINTLEEIPGVISAMVAGFMPGSDIPEQVNGRVLVRNVTDADEVQTQQVPISSEKYFKQYKIQLLSGRYLEQERDGYNQQTKKLNDGSEFSESRIILNRSAVKALGFASPEASINQRIYLRFSLPTGEARDNPANIVGVVEDNMLMSMKRQPGPQYYSLTTYSSATLMSLEYEEAIEDSVQARVSEVLKESTGYDPVNFRFGEELVRLAFHQEEAESTLLQISGGLALFLSCIGLFGLASFTMGRKVKEVGVRKALGSDVPMLVRLFLWRFSKPVLIANLIAAPIAIYFVLQWIEKFPYQLEKIWLLPIALSTATAVLLVSLLTVGWITWRAASQRPVLALRYE